MSITKFLETIQHDLLYAMRTIRKNPLFGVTAVLTLALAIGGNTTMFTVIRAVLLKPLEYRDPDRLVRITGGATPARFAEMRAAARPLTEIGSFAGSENPALTGLTEPEVLKATRVSASFLRIVGGDSIVRAGLLYRER